MERTHTRTGYRTRFVENRIRTLAPCPDSWWVCDRTTFVERLLMRLVAHRLRLPPALPPEIARDGVFRRKH